MQQTFVLKQVRDARRRIAASLAVAIAVAFAPPVDAAPHFAIDGLRVTPPIGQFGALKIGSCDIQFLEGCSVIEFTLTNVGSDPILISSIGIQSPVQDVTIGGSDCVELPLVTVDGQLYLSLAPGEDCSVTVGMGPLFLGRVERTLEVLGYQFNPILIMPLFVVGVGEC
jgi:hypothetical protein